MDQDANSSSDINSFAYCGETWTNFWGPYNSVDESLRLTLCILGIITNTLNIIIFSQKHMKNAFNKILIALCVTDLLFLLRKVIESIVEFHRSTNGDGRTLDQVKSELFASEIFYHIFHTSSIFLTLLIGFWWYLTVSQSFRWKSWFTERTAYFGIFTVVALSSILVAILQNDFHYNYDSIRPLSNNLTAKTEVGQSGRWELEHVGLWILGAGTKLIPCLILTIQSALSVRFLDHNKKMRRKPITSEQTNQPAAVASSSEQIQITRMILAILLIRLVTELPMGILNGIQAGTKNRQFHYECLYPMFLFFSLCEYVSTVTSFFVYVILSGKFRATICQLVVNVLYIPYSSSSSTCFIFNTTHSRKTGRNDGSVNNKLGSGNNSHSTNLSTTTVCTNSAATNEVNEEDAITTAV